MNNSIECAAMDIGFGTNKLAAGPISTQPLQKREFASSAVLVTDLTKDKTVTGVGTRRIIVPVHSSLYEVTTDQLSSDDLSGQILHERFVHSPEYEAIFKAGLVTLGASHIKSLVLGLPIQTPASARDRVRKMASGRIELGQYGACQVDNVHVTKQGVGALQAFLFDSDVSGMSTLQDSTILLLDIGHKTLDFVRVDRRREIRRHSGSIPFGISAILDAMGEWISKEYDVPAPTISQLNRAMRERQQTITIRGKRESLRPALEKSMPVVHNGLDEVLNRVGDTSFLDAVILCGGGAHYYSKALRQKLRREIQIMKTPGDANLRGYLLLAESLVKK